MSIVSNRPVPLLVLCIVITWTTALRSKPLSADEPLPVIVSRWLVHQQWVRDATGPVVSLGQSGQFDDNHIFAPSVVFERGQYVMWYCGSRGSVANRRFALGQLRSRDGRNFVPSSDNPVLNLDDGRSVLTPAILRTPVGFPLREEGKLRMWFTAADLTASDGVHTIHDTTSRNGARWSVPSERQLEHAYAPTVIKEGDTYRMWYTDVSQKPWSIRHARSSDGTNWQITEEPVLRLGQDWEQDSLVYPYVVKADRAYLMWYGAYWSQRADTTAIGLAVSEDGINWHKNPHNPVFRPDPLRPWESHYVTSHSVARTPDGGWRLWYASRTRPPFTHKYYAIGTAYWQGLAHLRQRSQAVASEQLERFRSLHPTLSDWTGHAAHLRHSILSEVGLWPLPQRCPLNPIVHSESICDGYTVENVAIETLPGFFATGNLYRPTGGAKPYPAVLSPHGHFRDDQNRLNGRVHPDIQTRCATLARMGAIVFVIDMVGAVDSNQIDHNASLGFSLQLWNNIRALDYLCTQPDVDPTRIGVTGASGGGSQTVSLAAVDPRVTVSVPVVMVSAMFDGGCSCESGPPVFRSRRHETNLAQLAAMAAPRPMMLISCGADWTAKMPHLGFPYIRDIYALYDKTPLVENLHLGDEDHDYGASKRAGAYRFLARHLDLPIESVMREGEIDESQVTIHEPRQLRVFTAENPRPKHSLSGGEAIGQALAEARKRAR